MSKGLGCLGRGRGGRHHPGRDRRRLLQPPGRAFAGRGRAVGAGGERLPAPRGPHPEPGGHRAGRRQLREVHAGGGHEGPGQRGPGRGLRTRQHPERPRGFRRLQAAQDQLSGALSRLLVVAEAYPDLKATPELPRPPGPARRDGEPDRRRADALQRDGRATTTRRASVFPTGLFAGLLGFHEKALLQGPAGRGHRARRWSSASRPRPPCPRDRRRRASGAERAALGTPA